MEFRSPSDGAWYGARVAVQRGALRVMYEEFPEELDEWYEPAKLAAAAASSVAALRARFRAVSTALDDARCRDLRPGDRLCVLCALDGDEQKYYDAVLQSVAAAPHRTLDGEERCPCRFTVRWAEGPRAGSEEEVGVADVCRVLSSPLQDPVLDEFLDGVTKLLGSDDMSATPAAQVMGSEAADSVSGDAPPGFYRKYGTRKKGKQQMV
ncbi:hypothetical protein PR202_ga04521 [Eleusine coracana subsp. coracana]|uniref:SAWADEE domain-containing protein n=1 Tax=Eleusine coracana subsp. coracana TaxID=191504 RepID=A0AAV5BS93_ELECO|nr:hypothetical protein PR202_ga04521 [Eleusine coracana subsp. coracana]